MRRALPHYHGVLHKVSQVWQGNTCQDVNSVLIWSPARGEHGRQSSLSGRITIGQCDNGVFTAYPSGVLGSSIHLLPIGTRPWFGTEENGQALYYALLQYIHVISKKKCSKNIQITDSAFGCHIASFQFCTTVFCTLLDMCMHAAAGHLPVGKMLYCPRAVF